MTDRLLTTDELIFDLIRTCWGCPGCQGFGHVFYGSNCFVCRACEPYRNLVRKHLPGIMDMDTPAGSKVQYIHGFNGWDGDIKQARETLNLGSVYTVKRIDVGESQTSVWLEEFPGVPWNHVLFTNAEAA